MQREVIVGYIIWDSKTNKPYRPTLGSDWRMHKAPARIYQTEKMAMRLGGTAIPVYVKVDDETYNT